MTLFIVWLTFVIGALALYTIGYYTKNDLLRILAVILLFTCGSNIDPTMGGGIQISTGANVTYTLIDNVSTLGSQGDTYTTFSSHLYGWYMMAVALLILIYILFERRYPNPL